jgi:hypothetical protein
VCCTSESLAGGDPVGDVSKTVWVKRVGACRGHAVRITAEKTMFVRRGYMAPREEASGPCVGPARRRLCA